MKHKFLSIIFILITSIYLTGCRKALDKEQDFPVSKAKETVKKEPETKPKKKKVPIQERVKLEPYKFTRGLYLTAYTVASERFDPILKQAKNSYINTVVFDLKNMNGNIFFDLQNNLFQTQDNIVSIIDLASLVDKLHENNFRAVARIVMFHDQFLAEHFPELRPTSKTDSVWQESQRRVPSWLDPSHPGVQQNLLNIIEEAARLGIDEIQLDYVRFPTQGNLSDAQFRFEAKDRELAARDSNYVYRSKKDIIDVFLKKVRHITWKYDTTLTADIFAIVAWQFDVDIQNTGQNINLMSQNLDALHPMVYSSHFAKNFSYRKNIHNEPFYIVYKCSKLVEDNIKGKCRNIPYIQANPWRVNFKEEYIHAQIAAVQTAGANGFLLWNSSNKYQRVLQWVKSFYDK